MPMTAAMSERCSCEHVTGYVLAPAIQITKIYDTPKVEGSDAPYPLDGITTMNGFPEGTNQ